MAQVFLSPVTFNDAISLLASKGIIIPSGAPGVTTNTLYSSGGALYFNGVQLAAGAGASVGSATPIVESGAGAVGTSANASREDHVHPAAAGGGGITTGTATLDFGSAPGTNYVSVVITGQTGITGAKSPIAYMADDATATHNSLEHLIIHPSLTCGSIVNGTGFTIHALSDLRLSGTFTVRWSY